MEVKLSVVVITFNEEKNIARCLQSVQQVADEIVVVDSLSTDRTVKIAASLGARVVQHPFAGHIEQKNHAITCASYPHILSLDADEELGPELEASILKAKQNFTHDGYYMNRLSSYCGHWVRHGGWYPDRKLRLWDSRKGQWGGQNPHDKFMLQPGCRTARLRGDLLHYTYHSIEQHTRQIDLFSSIAATAAFEKGKKARLWKLLVKPPFKFLRDYVFKAGFLDGYYGFVIARSGAHVRFWTLAKLRDLWRLSQAGAESDAGQTRQTLKNQ